VALGAVENQDGALAHVNLYTGAVFLPTLPGDRCMSDAPSTPLDGKPKDDAARLRDLVDRRLAEAPVRSSGEAVVGLGAAARSLAYDVTAAYVPVVAHALDARQGEPQAAVFTIAYTLKDAPAAQRPVCFAFNGGPGSASVWLHLGALGPKRVAIHDDGSMPAPPYAVADNPHTWLEHFDLVFIDPPHTGFSITVSEEARKHMLSVDGDVEALAEVMRAWLARHQRWGSAVYLAGESYGTTRGAALADKLLDLGVALSGLVLVSCAMDLQTIFFGSGNELPFALYVPAFACTAQYHGKLKGRPGASPADARAAAEAFVMEDYLGALHRGAALTGAARSSIARRLAELTGLDPVLVEQHNLRIDAPTFFTELLRAEGRIVGRLESRVSGPMAASRSREWEFDPGIEAIAAPYTMAANAYFAQALGLQTEQRYHILSMDVNKSWNWNRGESRGNSYATTSPDLARALRRNPHLRVLVASGHYDLGTPYSATNYSLAQLNVPADVLPRVTHHYYDAGHMMYTREADLAKLKADLAGWMEVPPPQR
jgi:carboxypeptidase C (cathepsin A)